MPQVEVDVQNIPDIIEAQLTLSYSRLSDLIRIIVDQGNSHDDEITGIHEDVVDLRSENERLKREIEELKSRGADQSLHTTVALLKKEVERLSSIAQEQTKQISDHHGTHTNEEAALRDRLNEQDRMLKALSNGLAETNQNVVMHESRLGLAEAFTELWGGRNQQIFTMAAHTDPNDRHSEFEHTIEERTHYLHTLPAFTTLFDELNVVRGMVQRQSADAIATKSEMRSRQTSDASGASAQEAMRAVEELEARILAVEATRLPPLEAALHNGAFGATAQAQAPAAPAVDLSGVEKDVGLLQDRLSMLEDRLRALLGQQAADGGEVSNAALVDLSHRVEWLEEVVEGLPGSAANAAKAATAAAESGSSEHRTPDLASSGTGPAAAAAADVEAASPVPQVPSSAASVSSPSQQQQRPGSANVKQARPGSGRAGGPLPPISPTHNSVDANTPLAGRSRSSVLGGHLNTIPQPVLESLKAQEDEQPRDPRRTSRSISVAMEPEDGLRRRVAVLEENCAILEVNKADRSELQALEDAIRQALAMNQLPQLPSSSPTGTGAVAGAANFAPRRPPAARVSLTDNNGLGVPDGVVMRPRSSAGGRPMFVGSSSVYLRDGAAVTQVTVSPTRLNGSY